MCRHVDIVLENEHTLDDLAEDTGSRRHFGQFLRGLDK